ncbi:MAG: hypothetical protein ABI604_03545 [Nitrospirota bacterium]
MLGRTWCRGKIPTPWTWSSEARTHSQTDLQFKANWEQTGSYVGDLVALRATLREYEVPVENLAKVWAEATLPDGSTETMTFVGVNPGQFEGELAMAISGLYTIRMRAQGATFRGSRFEREQTFTASAYPAGYVPPSGHEGERPVFCEVLECLLGRDVLTERATAWIKDWGIDVDRLRKCVAQHCEE